MKRHLYSYIRFSTPEQLKGDSLRRQMQIAEDYAKKYDMELKTLQDLGISGFHGAHISTGKFGEFLKLVENGKIDPGSVLICESFDRISRQQIEDALQNFLMIINKGIEVVTYSDGERHFVKGKLDLTSLVLTISEMSRAHGESALKSDRLKAVWQQKRARINNRKLTGVCPAWLQLDNDKFKVIEEKANVVVRIFELSSRGKGAGYICRLLNAEGITTFTSKAKYGWQKSYILKILSNEAVIGKFQPHRMENRKRIPVGDPVDDYFPRIISDNLFFAVQHQKKQRVTNTGRSSKGPGNPFSGLCVCGECGGKMHYIVKNRAKGWVYLACDNGRRKAGKCPGNSWNFEKFWFHFQFYVSEFSVLRIILGESDGDEIHQLNQEVLALKSKLDSSNSMLDRLISLYAKVEDENLLSKIQNQIDDVSLKITEAKKALKMSEERSYNRIDQISKGEIASGEIEKALSIASEMEDGDLFSIINDGLRSILNKIELKKSFYEYTLHFKNETSKTITIAKEFRKKRDGLANLKKHIAEVQDNRKVINQRLRYN